MIYLSKSKYCGLWQCPKIAWMAKYKPEEVVLDPKVKTRLDAGNVVGDLAMGLFGDFVEVTAYNGEKLDLTKMIENTKTEMAKGTNVICEASFQYNGLYCAVDILKKENGGYAIYEVKSSSKTEEDKKDDRPVYIADVAYQKYVLEKCGINVTGTYLVNLNKDYVFDGTLDLNKLFVITDVADEIKVEEANIKQNLDEAEIMLASDKEPNVPIDKKCKNPYLCGFWQYCSNHLPKPSVFNLHSIHFSTAIKHYKNGLTSYEDLLKSGAITNEKHIRQMEHYLNDLPDYVDKANVKEFLNKLTYPLYFLDFETIQTVIPEFKGTKPYTQVPFQYSLHYIEYEGGPLLHKEFLAESGKDPLRAIAERLCEDIPKNVRVVAYYKSFECTRLKELAEYFPDLSEHLLNIKENVEDLLEPFSTGYYYNKKMGGSFSIKSVLPALFPDDDELNYKNLELIHNGAEAMTIFPKIKDMPYDEAEFMRKRLLEYCKLDTYAMVKLWEKLNEAVK